jgi:hypothetical protein
MERTVRRPSAATLLFMLLLLATAGTVAQQAAPWNPRTGDAWVDRTLADVNRYGSRYPDAFVDELTRYLGAPRALVSGLLDAHWAPGDVYYACALAQAAGQPCRAIADTWARDHGQGWSAITQRYGVAPGSAAFHRLKRGLVGSYDHWGRPLEIDDSLHADFPGRPVAKAPAAVPPPATSRGKRARKPH